MISDQIKGKRVGGEYD